MPTDCADAALPVHSPVSRVLVERCQPFIPVITALVTVLSFFSGILLTTFQAHKSAVEAENTEWRDSLQKISFEEKDLVPSAFLLESFIYSRSQQHKDQARQLQISMLDRTTRPEIFDLVFGSMLSDARNADDVHDILGVGVNLNGHLRNLYAAAIKGLPGGAKPPLESFLKQPQAVLDADGHPLTEQDKTMLNRLYVLMWELDSFSDGMNCIWNTASNSCPHLQTAVEGVDQVLLVNHTVSPVHGPKTFPSLSTCSVQHAELEKEYTCE